MCVFFWGGGGGGGGGCLFIFSSAMLELCVLGGRGVVVCLFLIGVMLQMYAQVSLGYCNVIVVCFFGGEGGLFVYF